MLKEFRDFALRGNVLDLAVAVIIGGAFGGIVQSMIKDVIMPVIGIAGSVDFSNQYVPLSRKGADAVAAAAQAGQAVPGLDKARELGPVIAWGNFITITLNFMILAFCIFLVVKAFNIARRRFEKEKEAGPPPAPPADVALLTEIRDLLRARG
ncbi:MAG: large conductance mechanosensitive channel protein MscL [Phycisphaerae bacterium]|nr:large conductance mechanosensitive channel protein MscL [Phycisphaerae bacterium]